jgi:hypothetical protein
MTLVSFSTVLFLKEISVISCTLTFTLIGKIWRQKVTVIKSCSFQVGKERETAKGEREAEEGQGKGGERTRREREGEGRCEEGSEKGKLNCVVRGTVPMFPYQYRVSLHAC